MTNLRFNIFPYEKLKGDFKNLIYIAVVNLGQNYFNVFNSENET